MKHFCKRFAAGLLICLMMLTGACGAGAGPQENPARTDMKGVWVSTVYNLDYPAKATTNAEELRRQADEILQGSADMGMNAVFLQVRPCADSLYPSEIFPWSVYLTGSQDAAPSQSFDPLAYWVEKAHSLGLELHAWINPFRVTRGGQEEWEKSSAQSPARLHPDWVVAYEGNYYFNPGIPEVRELVIQGAEEIAKNYDVDGVHLDDYFYPGTDFDDQQTFTQYGGEFKDIADWRRDNVNRLIKELGERLQAADPDLSFGVSPAGVWANKESLAEGSDPRGNQTYFTAYADTRRWVKEGWLDYICPQIYWYIGHKNADYKTLANWWAQTVEGTGVRLYIGMADYQAGNENPDSPWHGTKALEDQLALNKTLPQVSGEVHFRYKLMAADPEIAALYRQVYGQGDQNQEKPEQPETPPAQQPETPQAIPRLSQEHSAYIQGADGLFRPEDSLSRAEAAAMLARLTVDEQGQPLFDQGQTYRHSFADVKDQWHAPYIGFAAQYGLVNGYEDGTFRPDRPVTRAELVKLLAAYFPESAAGDGQTGFRDAPQSHWAAKAVAYAAQAGWTGGYEDGTFRPDQPVTRAEAVRLINGALGRRPDSAHIQLLEEQNPFGDMDASHWAWADILEAACGHEAK